MVYFVSVELILPKINDTKERTGPPMELSEILRHCDHTLLKPESTWEQIQTICDDGMTYGCASACIPPCYVKRASEHVGNSLKICTVIGFPLGYSTTAVKVFETENAIRHGADEIDMVVNIGWVKDQRWDRLLAEIRALKLACAGHILKVIVETCLLTEAEKIKMCEIVTEAGADYIKTSTGFSTAGAAREDITLFRQHIGSGVKIKAAGGITTLKDAEDFLLLGACRLGTSRIVQLVKQQQHVEN